MTLAVVFIALANIGNAATLTAVVRGDFDGRPDMPDALDTETATSGTVEANAGAIASSVLSSDPVTVAQGTIQGEASANLDTGALRALATVGASEGFGRVPGVTSRAEINDTLSIVGLTELQAVSGRLFFAGELFSAGRGTATAQLLASFSGPDISSTPLVQDNDDFSSSRIVRTRADGSGTFSRVLEFSFMAPNQERLDVLGGVIDVDFTFQLTAQAFLSFGGNEGGATSDFSNYAFLEFDREPSLQILTSSGQDISAWGLPTQVVPLPAGLWLMISVIAGLIAVTIPRAK